MAGIIITIGVLIWLGYLVDWSGFSSFINTEGKVIESKKLWDWLELILVPAGLAITAYWLNSKMKQTEFQIAHKGRELDRQIANDRFQEIALQNYLDRMSDLILKENLTDKNVNTLMRSRTLAILPTLHKKRKKTIIQFLWESGLIEDTDQNISLLYANIDEIEFIKANLAGVNLRGSSLEKADFRYSNLSGADLSYTNLQNTLFYKANLKNTSFKHANLTNANLKETALEGADLEGVNMNGASLINLSTDKNFNIDDLANILSKAKTLANTQLEPELEKKLKLINPQLFSWFNNLNEYLGHLVEGLDSITQKGVSSKKN